MLLRRNAIAKGIFRKAWPTRERRKLGDPKAEPQFRWREWGPWSKCFRVARRGDVMVNSERLVGADPSGSLGVLGKYRLIAKLGQGGMAGVFLAAAGGPLSMSKLCVVK